MKTKILYPLFIALLAGGFVVAARKTFPLYGCTVAGFEWFILGIALMTYVFHFTLDNTKTDYQKFIRTFMVLLTIKFLFSMAILLGGVMLYRSEAKCFLLAFISVYITFLIIETIAIFKVIRRNTK